MAVPAPVRDDVARVELRVADEAAEVVAEAVAADAAEAVAAGEFGLGELLPADAAELPGESVQWFRGLGLCVQAGVTAPALGEAEPLVARI